MAMKKITFRKPKILSFRLSTRKVGGIRFVRVGKLVFSFCVSKKAWLLSFLAYLIPMNEEIYTTIFISLTQRFDLACKEVAESKNEKLKDYWREEADKALQARRYIVEKIWLLSFLAYL